MDYNFGGDFLLLDIPGRNRLIIAKDELKNIKEFGRSGTEPYCEIHLANGGFYRYTVSMDEILKNLKPMTFL